MSRRRVVDFSNLQDEVDVLLDGMQMRGYIQTVMVTGGEDGLMRVTADMVVYPSTVNVSRREDGELVLRKPPLTGRAIVIGGEPEVQHGKEAVLRDRRQHGSKKGRAVGRKGRVHRDPRRDE